MATKKQIEQLAVRMDETLVRAGKAAKRRQRRRAVKRALKAAGKVALLAGVATVTVAAARKRRGKTGEA